VFILDSLFIGGLRFVLEKVADVADRELNDPERWRVLLLEAQLAHESGEITAEELAAREREILARLRELHPGAGGAVLSADDLESVDVVADVGDPPG
jgi:3-dehydroquinate synthase class II